MREAPEGIRVDRRYPFVSDQRYPVAARFLSAMSEMSAFLSEGCGFILLEVETDA